MGDEVIGHVSALQYSAALENPKNEAFVKKYRAKYGKVPSYYSETNYTTAQMIHEVIKNNKGNFPGVEEFVKQVAALKLDTLRGPVTIDEMRNPVQNIYIKKVEKKKMFGYDKEELCGRAIGARRSEWRERFRSPACSRSSPFSTTCCWRSRVCGGRSL